jgi:predicted CXXCH cytochrome family protein
MGSKLSGKGENMSHRSGVLTFVLFLLVILLPRGDLCADNLSCLICHGELKGNYVTQKGVTTSLHVDGEKFAASVHGDLDCTFCHLKYQDNPHESAAGEVDESILKISKAIAAKSPVDPIAQAACTQCHEEIYAQVKQSVHGKNIFEKKESDAALCVDCHGSPHEIVPVGEGGGHGEAIQSAVAYERIVTTCGKCHEKKSVSLKYGFSTKIIDRYNESFHGKKYHLGGRNLPVCTTCHGSHDVRSQKDPEAMVNGEKKVALCGQCHAGANAKFVAAITHKPLGKDNPIPYYAEKGLILLTFTVISGCALHILLDIFALVRTTVGIRRRTNKNGR